MKSAALLLEGLRSRDLETRARQIAHVHHASLEQVIEPLRDREIVRARHAIWIWQVAELGSIIAVSRLWGVDRTAIRAALDDAEEDQSSIVFVLLDEFKDGAHHYRFSYFAGQSKRFCVTNVAGDHSTWFATYEGARAIWEKALDLAGHTFLSVSNGAPAAPVGGA